MLPIDYEDLGPDEVKALTEWFASPQYQTLRTVLQAQQVRACEEAVAAIAAGHQAADYEDTVKDAQTFQNCLDLIEAAAQGYYGADATNKFPYQRLIPKMQ